MNFFARLSADHRLMGWCIVLVLSIPPTLGALGVRLVEPVDQGWVPQHVADELKRSQRLFSFNAPVVLVLQADDMFTAERIRSVHDAIAALRDMPEVEHLTWVGDIPEVTLRGDQTLLLPGADERPTQEALDAARTALTSHPLATNSLISPDGRTFLLLIDTREREYVAVIRDKARKLLQSTGISTRVTGNLALYALHDLSLEQDHLRIQVMANVLVIILAVLIFRRPSAIFIAMAGPLIGVGWTLGWLNLIGQSENELAKIILPVLVMMIGFADGVHLVVRIRQLRGVGVSARDSVYDAVMHIGPACFLTSLTTAIGFGSLIVSDSEMISGFGRVSAIGVVVTFISVVLVIPLLSHSWVGRRMHVQASRDPILRFMNYAVGIITYSSRHALLVTIAGFGITAGCMYLTTLLVPDDRITDRIPHDSDEWRAMRYADENLGGIRYLQLIVTWPELASRSDVWTVVRECEDILANEELIGSITSVRTTLTVFRGPDRRDNSVLINKLPEKWRAKFYRPEIRKTQVVARLQDSGIAQLEPMFVRIDQQIAELETQFPGMEIEQVSDQAIEGRTVRNMIEDLMKSLLMAAVIIFGVLAIAFRSLRVGLISIMPNIMPLAITGALRMTYDQSLGIASACSFAICLGIAVDDTIHYLIQFRTERRRGLTPLEANQKAFVSVGSALIMTTLVMIAGLGTVMTSQLPPHVNFAAMGCTTLAAALVADLIFLPAVLTLFPGKLDVTAADALPAPPSDNT